MPVARCLILGPLLSVVPLGMDAIIRHTRYALPSRLTSSAMATHERISWWSWCVTSARTSPTQRSRPNGHLPGTLKPTPYVFFLSSKIVSRRVAMRVLVFARRRIYLYVASMPMPVDSNLASMRHACSDDIQAFPNLLITV